MTKIRVLIADDAVVVRRMVGDILGADPELEVAGVAANGRIALAKIPQVNPDVVILDVEMPEMDGLETLVALRKIYPTLPVIMFSTLTERGGSATLDALARGATDYVTKPANVGSVALAQQRIRDELITKIKLYGSKNKNTPAPSLGRAPLPPTPVRARSATTCSIDRGVAAVIIGVSTGGPNALAEVMPAFPADFPAPILIVQHMPPLFTRLLAERLDGKASIRVHEAKAGDLVRPGHAWLAPGDFHMAVGRDGTSVKLRLHQGPPENSCRPAVDVLFRSACEVYGGNLLAVVMTGMGQDGLRGCESVRELGGSVFVQDEKSSVVWGMPGFVAKAGLAQRTLPLDQIGPEIVRRVMSGHRAAVAVG